MYSFAYINIVDFSETDAVISIISVIAFCAATVSFYFAVKSKSIGVLRALGITTILTPLISFYALRPAGYQFISVFTDFPAAVKMGEAFFGWEAFYLFFEAFGGTEENVFPYFIWVICFLLTFAFPIIHVVTGFLSLVYAGDLRSEANCNNCEKTLKKLTVFLITVSAIMVVGTSAEIAHSEFVAIRFQQELQQLQQEYETNKDSYVSAAKAEFDSIDVPMNKEDAMMLANEKGFSMEWEFRLTIYEMYQEILIRDDDNDGIYETKEFLNMYAFENEIEKGPLEKLELGSSIEDLYNIADFSNFISYTVQEAEDETHIEIRICDKNSNDEYWLDYENGELVYKTTN